MIRSKSQIWAVPIVLGVSTTIGLVAALLGNGVWDLVSAVTLGAPVLAGIWYSLRRKPSKV